MSLGSLVSDLDGKCQEGEWVTEKEGSIGVYLFYQSDFLHGRPGFNELKFLFFFLSSQSIRWQTQSAHLSFLAWFWPAPSLS